MIVCLSIAQSLPPFQAHIFTAGEKNCRVAAFWIAARTLGSEVVRITSTLTIHQLRREIRKTFGLPICISVLDDDAYVTAVAQSFLEHGHTGRVGGLRGGSSDRNPRDVRRLLRVDFHSKQHRDDHN